MNYRHVFHAGNFADIAKHLALISVLDHLRKKDAGFCVVDTHAGRGVYDLAGAEAARTGEAMDGIIRLINVPLPDDVAPLLARYLSLVRGPLYPGSPLLAAKLLRPQDRLVAVEKHPEDAATLTETLRPFAKARVEAGDGYKRVVSLLPPPERRGVVLIDPPFEAPDEFRATAQAVAKAYRRFATGIYIVWFPVKSEAEASGFCGEVLAAGASKVLRIDVTKRGVAEGKLAVSGLLVINPPWQFADDMRASLAVALPHVDAEVRFDWLVGSD